MSHSEKELWSRSFPVGAPDKETLGKLVEEDHDPAETAYYEAVADPTYVLIEQQRRRFRGMLRRRLRHRSDERPTVDPLAQQASPREL